MTRLRRKRVRDITAQTTAQPPLVDDHRIEILLTTYQVERQDEQNTSILITAVTGTGLAFIIATTAYLNGQGRAHHLPDWLALGAAVPVWSLIGLIIYQVAASGLRMRYIMHLESLLTGSLSEADPKTFPRYIALHHGLYESGGPLRNPAHVSLAIITFLSPLALGVLFTCFVMTDVARDIGARPGVVIGYRIFYCVVAFLNTWVLLVANYGMTDRRKRKLNSWADSKLNEHKGDW